MDYNMRAMDFNTTLASQAFAGGTEPVVGSEDVDQAQYADRDSYVLIVDDDPDACEIFRYAIRSINLSSQEAHNGIEALEQIKARIPMLILLDLVMPIMDGFQVLTHLRSDPKTRSIPVIVVTSMREGREILHLPGVSKVLVKGTFSIAQIRKLLTETLPVGGPSVTA